MESSSAVQLHKKAANIQCVQELQGHTDRVWNLAWTPALGAVLLATCSSDQSIRIWAQAQGPKSQVAVDEENKSEQMPADADKPSNVTSISG